MPCTGTIQSLKPAAVSTLFKYNVSGVIRQVDGECLKELTFYEYFGWPSGLRRPIASRMGSPFVGSNPARSVSFFRFPSFPSACERIRDYCIISPLHLVFNERIIAQVQRFT